MIYIAMMSRTDEPMEGVVFDVQDHARRTGTRGSGAHGEMISSDLHGAEEPIRWLLRPVRGAETGQCLIELLHLRRRRTFHQRHFGRARPRGSDPFSVERWPWKVWDITHDDHDVIQPIGHLERQTGQYWHVWHDGGAQGGLTFCSRMPDLP